MVFSENEKATYLFCAQFPQTRTTPLTTIEWNVTVKSLAQKNLEPAYLFDCSPSELINILSEAGEATEKQKLRIIEKVENRQKLGFGLSELEELVHKGFGILFRSDFPNRLKRLSLKQRPPFYYYIGDIKLLNSSHIFSVVGSRNPTDEELNTVAMITAEAAKKGITIVSGGARGVDSTAVDSALQHGGKAIIFPSEGLTTWARKKEYRKYIQTGHLLLLSVQHIEARFNAPYAMQRNKFIHSTGDATLVASSQISGTKKSGTWEGVLENLKEEWSPLYVIGQSDGVEKLKEMGAAKPFTSLEDIFKPNTLSIQTSLQKHFTNLVIRANELGLSEDEIQNAFNNSFNSVFNKLIVKEEFATLDIEDQHQKETDEDEYFSVNPLPFDQTDDSLETAVDSNKNADTNEDVEQMKWNL